MDLTIITTLISPLIVVACLCVGWVIKKLCPGETVNQFIPLIVMVLGIVLNVWSVGVFAADVVVAGAVSGLASTGLYEAFANMLGLAEEKKEEKEIEEEEEE
jgi:hypothetical protein